MTNGGIGGFIAQRHLLRRQTRLQCDVVRFAYMGKKKPAHFARA